MRKLNKWTLIWRLIFNPKTYYGRHNFMLALVIEYALQNYEEKRGTGASDVLIYDMAYGRDIFLPETSCTMNTDGEEVESLHVRAYKEWQTVRTVKAKPLTGPQNSNLPCFRHAQGEKLGNHGYG
jgi:hypothetical protein